MNLHTLCTVLTLTIIAQLNKIKAQQPSNQSQIQINLNQTQCLVNNCAQCEDGNPQSCATCNQFFAIAEGYCVWCPNSPSSTNEQLCNLCDNSCMNCDVFNGQCLQCLPGFQLVATQQQGPKCEHCQITNCAICPRIDDCQSCEFGYYLQNGTNTCQTCSDPNCDMCNGSLFSCQSCHFGYLLDEISQTCNSINSQCLNNFYYDSDKNQCAHCPEGCSECYGAQCWNCMSGYYQPIVNLFTYSTQCLPCSNQCKECQFTSIHCTSCSSPAANPFYGNCSGQCLSGYYLDYNTGQCATCQPNCVQCSSLYNCQVCQMTGFYILQGGQCARVCPSGQYEFYPAFIQLLWQQIGNQIASNLNDTRTYKNQLEIQTAELLFTLYPFQIQTVTQNVQCIQCDHSCQDCLFFADHCIGCNQQSILAIETFSCNQTCNSNSYYGYSWDYSAPVCRSCQPPCLVCSAPYDCQNCSLPYQAVNGTCQFQGIVQAVNNYCSTGYFFQDFCYPQCPNGLIQSEITLSCMCSFNCQSCSYDLIHDKTQCLTCNRPFQYIWNDQCVSQCPFGTFTLDSTYNNQSSNLNQNYSLAQGICLNACPKDTKILIDYSKLSVSQTCVGLCPADHRQIGNNCVPQVCGSGFYENYDEIQTLGGLQTNDSTAFQAFGVLLNDTQKSKICQACPLNCDFCSAKECFTCNGSLFLDTTSNTCVSQCQAWQNIQQLSDTQAQCVPCIYGCSECQVGMTLYQNNCYHLCGGGQKGCQDGLDILTQFVGTGSPLGYLSGLKSISLNWKALLTKGIKVITVLRLVCEVQTYKYNLNFIVSAQTQQYQDNHTFSLKNVPFEITDQKTPVYGYTFTPNTFHDNQLVMSTCMTYIFCNTTQETFIYTHDNQFNTFPQPSGQFHTSQMGENKFTLTLDQFNPIFGLSVQDYLYQQGEIYNQGSSPNLTKIEEELYQPYHYQVTYEINCSQMNLQVARINPSVPLWDFTSYDHIQNKTQKYNFQVADDACFQFKLRVWNDWVSGAEFLSPVYNVTPNSNTASVDYYINKLLNANESSIQVVMKELEQKFQNMQKNQETNYCNYGLLNKTNQNCTCFLEENPIYIQNNINETRTTFKKLKQILSTTQLNRNSLSAVSALILYYTNNTCAIVEHQILQEATNLINNVLTMNVSLDYNITKNLIISAINVHDSLTLLIPKNKSRILSRVETQGVTYNVSETPNNTHPSKNGSYVDLGLQVDDLIQTLVYNLFSYTDKEIHISQGQISIMMYTLKKVINPSLFHTFNLGQIQVLLPFSSTVQYINNDDQLKIMMLKKTQEPWIKNEQGIQLLNNQYLQINIVSKKHDTLLFTTPSPDFLIKLFFNDPSLSGQETCVYYDQAYSFWSTQQVTTDGKVGQIACSSNHLSEFSVSPSFDSSLRFQSLSYRNNAQIGIINFLIVILCLLVICISSCVVNEKFIQQTKITSTVTIREANEEHNMSINKGLDNMGQPAPQGRQPSIEDEIPVSEKNFGFVQDIHDEKDFQQPKTVPFKVDDIIVNNGPALVEYEGQSQQQIIIHPKGKNSIEQMQRWRLYNYVLWIFPEPLSWRISVVRICVLFLWLTCYELIFSILLISYSYQPISIFEYQRLNEQFFKYVIITFVVSNVVNYFYALLAKLCCKYCAVIYKFKFKGLKSDLKMIVSVVIVIVNLFIITAIYATLQIDNLSLLHGMNILFQFIFNMVIFDLLMELSSKYPGFKALRSMRKLKLMEF